MRMVRGAAIALLMWAAAGIGCRQDEPVKEPIAESVAEPAETPPDDAFDARADTTAAKPELSAEQKAAIARMQAAGAGVELDEAGFPVHIDLASERVFADEGLVRAALLFPNLKGLRLAVSSVPQATLAELASLTGLEELFLQDAATDDAGITALLTAMPNLRRLTLRRLNNVTDDGLAAIARAGNLDVVALIEMNQLTTAGLEPLARLPRLRSLDLRNCGRLTVEDFGRLADFKTMAEVKLGGPAVSDAVADIIICLPQVRSLTIEDAEISGAFLDKLATDKATVERLETLAFARCYGITDEALAAIGKFSNLQTLSLRDIMLSGQFLVKLREEGKALLSLTSLTVTNAFLDDAAIGQLPTVAPNLERLDLRGNPGITDASGPTFEKLSKLKELKLE